MDPRRLVLVETGGPGGGSGSGYLIGPQLVLTALHVLFHDARWAQQVTVRVGHPRYGAGPVQRSAEVCWPDLRHGDPPADALDMALLWLDAPVPTAGGPVRWGRPGGVAPLPFEGAGFPAFAAEGDGAEPQYEYMRGALPPVSTATSGWVLDCPVWPAPGDDDERPWAGASGSAVFCHDRLVGVAIEDNRAMDWRRLLAAPVHEALGKAGFATLVARHGHPGTVTTMEEVTASDAAASPGETDVMWPVEVGPVPALASAFRPRSVLRERVEAARASGEAVLLTQVLSGGGGVGKTQLAAACATDALKDGVDLVVWAAATETQQVITQYAQAAARIRLPGADGRDAQADARALLARLSTTRRRWLVVLDDITDPAALSGWWPVSHTGSGWVLATTRLNDARLTGGGRTRVTIDVYTPDEAYAYLQARLTGDGMGHLLDGRAPDLADALGHLPLALSHAAAHMINEELTCTAYLSLFMDRQTLLDQALPESADSEGYGRKITTTLLLALDAVQAADTTGLAVPALRMAALLDPAGHPHALWSTPPVLDHLTRYRRTPLGTAPATGATPEQAHSALRLLHRYTLLTCDVRGEPRAVRIHALTARAVRETIAENKEPAPAATRETPAVPEFDGAVRAVAQALCDVWPPTAGPVTAGVLRANADALHTHAADRLWSVGAHPVLFQAGKSLRKAGLLVSAIAYWRVLYAASHQHLGSEHPDTHAARLYLASLQGQSGDRVAPLAAAEEVLAERLRILGADHPDTLAARAQIAHRQSHAGDRVGALATAEELFADRLRILGPDHPDTLATRTQIAQLRAEAGDRAAALAVLEELLADRLRVLGPDHPDTLATRTQIAQLRVEAGDRAAALAALEELLADRLRALGPDHPDTLAPRTQIAQLRAEAGDRAGALAAMEELLSDRLRALGPDHPATLATRTQIAHWRSHAGDRKNALAAAEELFAERLRVLGPDHANTLATRTQIAQLRAEAGDRAAALAALEEVLADRLRVLGPDHADTLATRTQIAQLRAEAGDRAAALAALEELLADRLRALGPDHADTLATRAQIAHWREQVGDQVGALATAEDLLADRLRALGPDHPDTLATRRTVTYLRRQVGDRVAALAAAEELLTDQHGALGPDHPDTLATRARIAQLRGWIGDRAGALAAAEELLTDRRRTLGPDHPDTLASRAQLADRRGQAGDRAGALAAADELLTDRRRTLGPDHPDTLASRAQLAHWQGQTGDRAGALAAAEELLTDRRRVLGPDHPDTLATRAQLAQLRGETGDWAGASAAMEELLADRLRVLGPDHADTLATRSHVAHWRGKSGDRAGALAAAGELLAERMRVLGPDHPDTLAARNHIGRLRRKVKKPAKGNRRRGQRQAPVSTRSAAPRGPFFLRWLAADGTPQTMGPFPRAGSAQQAGEWARKGGGTEIQVVEEGRRDQPLT